MVKTDRLAVLGPVGTFSDSAARKLSGFERVYYSSHEEIFEALKSNKLEMAIVAVENQLSGTIVENLDNIYNLGLHIVSEIIIPVHHCLCAISKDAKIETIYSHSQGFLQCKAFLSGYKETEKIKTGSTAEAFELIKKNNMVKAACIGPKISAEIYGLKVIEENIEDFKHNQTRFFLVSKKNKVLEGSTKTSIVFKVKHEPGSLVSCLQRLAKHNVNLTKLESRPIPEEPWEYLFYVDMDGSISDENVKLALSEMEAASIFVKILGSYPQEKK